MLLPRRFPRRRVRCALVHRCLALTFALSMVAVGHANAKDETNAAPDKHVVGATAVFKEVTSGLPFSARVDTGSESCSLHVEKVEIKNEARKPLGNIGKTIRFKVKNEQGQTAWIESKIAAIVRVHSSTLKDGDYDRRYKVPLTLQLGDVRKEVLVTLNDRTDMAFPLLVGRDFLSHDFLVDVDIDGREEPLAEERDDS